MKENWSSDSVLPLGVVIDIFTLPAMLADVTAVIWLSLSTMNDIAAVEPKETSVASLKFIPVMVTVLLPLVGPNVGVKDPMIGVRSM